MCFAPPWFQLKLHSSKGHGHVQNTQHRWKPRREVRSPTTKTSCSTKTWRNMLGWNRGTKHILKFRWKIHKVNKTWNTFEMSKTQKHRSKWEAINIIHHLYPRLSFSSFFCQVKSSCWCPKSKALQRDLCWQSEDVLFLSLCKLQFLGGITKLLWP